jgi:hypothetical protein
MTVTESTEPTAKQALAIFSLLFGRTEEERKPTFGTFAKQVGDAKARKGLEDSGYIKCEKVGRSQRVLLTDDGLRWAEAHLDYVLPLKAQSGTRVLEAVLRALGPFLVQRGASLAELVALSPGEGQGRPAAPLPTAPPAPGKTLNDGLATRIRAKSLELGAGRPSRRVRLADVRRGLPDVGRDEMDRELLELQRKEKLVLYPIDDPTDIQPEDAEAALMVAGFPRHILYLEQ